MLHLVYMRKVILTSHVDGKDDSNAQVSNNSSGDTNDQEPDNSDNVISSYGSENLSDDDGEELDIGKAFADWAVRNACTRTAFQEAIGILRHRHRVPKAACTLLHTPTQDKCGS